VSHLLPDDLRAEFERRRAGEPLLAMPASADSAGVVTPEADADQNVLRLAGEMWHVRHEGDGGEEKDFPDRADSFIRHLARMLAEPNRRFGASEFYPAPPGAAPLPHLGRDPLSDDRALRERKAEMYRLASGIEKAKADGDFATADKLQQEFYDLTELHEAEETARKLGHEKKCGPPVACRESRPGCAHGTETPPGAFSDQEVAKSGRPPREVHRQRRRRVVVRATARHFLLAHHRPLTRLLQKPH
jgi:hypothetical protein